MIYDQDEEEFELLLNDIINAYDVCPKRTKKLLLANLFERVSTLKIMLEETGVDLNEEKIHFTLTRKFDRIRLFRIEEARKFLGELMKKELP